MRVVRRIGALAGVMVAAVAGTAHAAATWNAGTLQESTITDCVSIIDGDPMSSPGVGVSSYVYEDYSAPPAANTPYYLAVTVFGIGDSCSGQVADIHLALPAHTTLNVSSATPIQCFPLESSGNSIVDGPSDTSGACPQSPSTDSNGDVVLDMASDAGFDGHTGFFPFWAIPMGAGVEIHIPVVTSQAITDHATAIVNMADGNSDPTLSSQVVVDVGAASSTPPAGTAQAVTNPTATNITNDSATLSAVFVYDYDVLDFSSAEFDWGDQANHTPDGVNISPSFGVAPYEVQFSVNISGLQPGCTYHWHADLKKPTSQVAKTSGDQTFTTTGSGGTCGASGLTGSGGVQGAAHTDRIKPLLPATALSTGLTPPAPEPAPNPPTPTQQTPPPNPTPNPAPPNPPEPAITPAITKLALASHAVKTGHSLTLDVTLNAAAKISVEIIRHVPASGHGKHRKKAHDIVVGTLTFSGKTGLNTLAFKTVKGHKLSAGHYEAKISLPVGKARTESFTVDG